MALGNINDIATFVAVSKAGGYTAATAQTGLTRSAIGKSIVRLEERLHVRLFNRTPRSFSLTDDGRAFYARCLLILEELEEAESMMATRSEAHTGLLRISLPLVLGQLYVMPIVERFLQQWPELRTEVAFSDRLVDLIDEGFDVALRIGEPKYDSSLISKTIASEAMLTCAAPAYLAAAGPIATPDDLHAHQCLFFASAGRSLPWAFQRDEQKISFSKAARLQADSADVLCRAAVNGMGIVHLPAYLMREAIATGQLHVLLPDYQTARHPIRIVYPVRKHLSPKVRLFIDFLAGAWQRAPL
ncbi:LysR family transcriptional regulator [Janthinobacterium aquaticum]|uniref:LysR family transcriptional regulator n=1 Tax=Janthinobacterium sp. FT58W TaxID=2654254 RepID=UPI00126567C3|nr:LysR family transcriptional regulator [Janthinobacterium sp. FT58W]KAB8042280.1 LysR family transcriptional regulator [Janthinobacterium sp. FT58W]